MVIAGPLPCGAAALAFASAFGAASGFASVFALAFASASDYGAAFVAALVPSEPLAGAVSVVCGVAVPVAVASSA